MKLYVTVGSPYARRARMLVAAKGLHDRVETIVAKTRTAGSPYYVVAPSGRVPFLILDDGSAMEDSQLICAYLDSLDGQPLFHAADPDWSRARMEAHARSFCDGVAVWIRETYRPENERSPGIMVHEQTRANRMCDMFEHAVLSPAWQGKPAMAHLVLTAALDFVKDRGFGDLTEGRPALAAWLGRMHADPTVVAAPVTMVTSG